MSNEWNDGVSDEVMGLKSVRHDQAVSLQSVQAHGKLQGLMLRMKLRQVYRNTTPENLECVYTFPLAWRSVLLGMAVELNGKRMTGTVSVKKKAEAVYEGAIQSGDLPVMLERSGKDLYTANLGNLQPGDEVVIELDYAQLLNLQGGLLRLSLPTTIAPRYGDEHAQGGLAQHQTTQANSQAEYLFYLSLDIAQPLAGGTISSPSHTVQQIKHQSGVTVKLQSQAFMDRDFVLTILGLKEMTFAMASADVTQPGQYTVLSSALATWDTAATRPAPLCMKVLVDGSGSMQGDSNAQARDALDWLFHQLQIEDEVSFSRFGHQPVHVLPRLQICTPAYQRRLRAEARNIQADLGGTEMEKALRSVITLSHEDERPVQSASILLITDGEVWDIERIVATVRQSGHRLFALGVGSSPAESLLRELAEVSGGACEMVSPNQSMQQAVSRLLDQMRRSCAVETHLLGLPQMLFESAGPREMTQGDTLHQWAQTSARPTQAPTMQWTLKASEPGVNSARNHKRQAAQLIWDEEGVLPRLFAAQRLLDTSDESQQSALAVQYQLITPHTNFILVHEREPGQKAQNLPVLQQIAQMQAAGAAGYGTVICDAPEAYSEQVSEDTVFFMKRSSMTDQHSFENSSALYRTNRTQTVVSQRNLSSEGFEDIEIPAFLRKFSDEIDPVPHANAVPPDAVGPATRPGSGSILKKLVTTAVEMIKPAPAKVLNPSGNHQGEESSQFQMALRSLQDPANPLVELLQRFNVEALGSTNFRAALSLTLKTIRTSFMTEFIMTHAKALGSPALVWACLLHWLSDTNGLELDRHAHRLIDSVLSAMDPQAQANLMAQLDQLAGDQN